MFFYEGINDVTLSIWFVALIALIALNEAARRSMWASMGLFIILPIFLIIFVWPNTMVEDSSVGSWFQYAKVYSALGGCLGFMTMKYIKGVIDLKYIMLFPPVILAVNTLEAVIRELQMSNFNGLHDDIFILGGHWHYINAFAGILNILTISGWIGIYISEKMQ